MTFEIYSDETVASLWLSDVGGCVRVQSDWTQPQAIIEHEGCSSRFATPEEVRSPEFAAINKVLDRSR